MIPRAGELFLIVVAIAVVLAFYRLPAAGDALGRWLGGKRQRSAGPPEKR